MAYTKKKKEDEDMAFVKGKKEEETSTPAAPGSTPAAGVIPSSGIQQTTPKKAGQSFATLHAYIQPNQPQAQQLAQNVTSGLRTEFEATKAPVEQAKTEISKQIQAGIPQQNQAAISKATTQPQNLTPADLEAFNKQKNLLYAGPKVPEATPEYMAAMNAVERSGARAELVGSEAGQKELITEKQKTRAPGITNLNQALVSMVPGASRELGRVGGEFKNLSSYLQGIKPELSAQVSQAQSSIDALNKMPQAQLDEAVGKFHDTVSAKLSNIKNKAIPDYQENLWMNLVPRKGALQFDQMEALGLTPAQWKELRAYTNTIRNQWGEEFPFGNYVDFARMHQKNKQNEPTLANVASADDYKYYDAARKLGGRQLWSAGEDFLPYKNLEQAGTFKPSMFGLFDYNTALSDAKTRYNRLLAERGGRIESYQG